MSSSKRSWLKAAGGLFLAALSLSPAWGSVPPQPGTINYIEGQSAIGGQALGEKSVGSAELAAGQSLSTQDGRVEILLTPGIFFRVDNHSSVRMISPGLADTVLALEKGRAMVEVADIRPENNVRVSEGAASTQLLKAGLYDFDADRGEVRIFIGKSETYANDQQIKLTRERLLKLNAVGKLKSAGFDTRPYEDDFFRWSALRSGYLAEGSGDEARVYIGAGRGWYGLGWQGPGWYWNPGFEVWTFLPAKGIFYSPFGWGFYSPTVVYRSPAFDRGYHGQSPYGFGDLQYPYGREFSWYLLQAFGKSRL